MEILFWHFAYNPDSAQYLPFQLLSSSAMFGSCALPTFQRRMTPTHAFYERMRPTIPTNWHRSALLFTSDLLSAMTSYTSCVENNARALYGESSWQNHLAWNLEHTHETCEHLWRSVWTCDI